MSCNNLPRRSSTDNYHRSLRDGRTSITSIANREVSKAHAVLKFTKSDLVEPVSTPILLMMMVNSLLGFLLDS